MTQAANLVAVPPSPDAAKLLLVDDHPENLLALEAILEPLSQDVVRATSGAEALKRLIQDDFAVILLDVQMPALDGFETAALIKERERTAHVPIIFLTAFDADGDRALDAYAVGAVDYLVKPFEATILRSKVEVFIHPFHLRRRAEELARQALHDGLTRLPNRTLFLDRVEVALARVKRRAATVGVLYFDLDGFKAVNDSHGHGAGDELLVAVAERVHDVLRPSDTLARLGGDEFTVLCDDILDRRDLEGIAHRVGGAVAEGVALAGGGNLAVTASIGISLAAESSTPEILLREADAAMYLAKQSGGGHHEIFDGEMRQRAARRVRAEHDLNRAIEGHELRLHYQPEWHLASGRMAGVEALVRWQDPRRGLLGPGEFISMAEEAGMIERLGAWVIREALEQGARWRAIDPRLPPVVLSVNVSARQLHLPSLVATVADALRDTDTDPSLLCLEVTEGAAMNRVDSTLAVLSELKDIGIRLAIDDFGTGYSSLAYLRQFPVDVLKIDRSLVRGADASQGNAAIVAAVIGLAQALGLTAVAEGIEEEGEMAELRRLGCDLAQGYLLGHPEPVDAMKRIVATSTTHPALVPHA